MAAKNKKAELERIDKWLVRLVEEAEKCLGIADPEKMDPYQAGSLAGKYLLIAARFMELRQQYDDDPALQGEWQQLAMELLKAMPPVLKQQFLMRVTEIHENETR
jgi:hypothetical protein